MEEVNRYYQGNITLEEAESYIAAGMMTAVRAFVANGYYLRRIRDEKLYKESGYKNFKEYLEDRYKKDEGWASKCIKVNQQLSEGGNSPILDSRYRDYSDKYKLVELASMTEEQRTQVSPDMSVKALREFRKGESENLVMSQENQVEESELEVTDAVQEVATLETPEPEPEKLSAYGTPIKVYPADSLIACPGCGGGHDCFVCHLQCDIRQECCRCVETTTGNPFPCEQIDRIDVLREEMGDQCQFVDLDLAYRRAGDHEPVPCCKKCKEPCQYACERSIQKMETQPQTCNTDPLSCPHRDDYSCTLTPDQKNTPGDGNHCERSCCWECKYHGMCEPECDSSAGRDGERPEFDAAWFVRKWVEQFPNDLKVVMRICREHLSNADRAKAVQKYISPYGARCQCCWEYDFSFHGFAGGLDFRIGRVQIHLKYGRFVTELLALYDPSSPEYDAEIGELNLSCRTENTLKRAGIDTVEKLVSMSDEELAAVRGMSARTMEEIRTKLEDLDSVDKPEVVIDTDYEEVQEDSDRPYTLADVGQEIVCLEAKYLGAPEDVKESTHYRKNMMRLDALHLLYDSMKG